MCRWRASDTRVVSSKGLQAPVGRIVASLAGIALLLSLFDLLEVPDWRAGSRAAASGNLGLIYLTEWRRCASLEGIGERHGRLLACLRAHPHIGFVLAHSMEHGPVVLGVGAASFHDLLSGGVGRSRAWRRASVWSAGTIHVYLGEWTWAAVP